MSIATTRDPTLAEVFDIARNAIINSINVAIPGRIEKYDEAEQKADVKPLIKLAQLGSDGERIVDTLPVIPEVPVVFPRNGDYFMSLPLAKGDFVLLVVCSQSIDRWVASSGDDVDPADPRRHDWSDAVCLPGLFPFQSSLSSAHKDNMVLGHDSGVQIHISMDLINLGEEDAAEFVALADKTDQRISDLEDAFNDFLSMTYNVHTHPYVDTPIGGATTSPTTQTGSPVTPGSSTAAEKVKAT